MFSKVISKFDKKISLLILIVNDKEALGVIAFLYTNSFIINAPPADVV